MCGFGVILRVTPAGETHEPIPESLLDAMDERIAWRGPDGSARYRDRVTRADGSTAEVAMVHRRLSIIDHDGGAQPMVRDGIAVVFNGCIYNHRELRADLESRGHVFESDHSDTEVLIHGWREWGEKLDDHLDGMYSAAIWDANRAAVHALRDTFGRKPLWLSFPIDHGVALMSASFFGLYESRFIDLNTDASTAWLAFGWGNRSPMFSYEQDITSGSVSTHLARVENERRRSKFIRALRALAELLIDVGMLAVAVLVAIFAPLLFFGDVLRELSSRLRHGRPGDRTIDRVLEQAATSRLEADVPIGCFISGGIDSSLIAHYASQHLDRLTTLTVRMPDDAYDESGYAERVAEHLGTEHVTIECDPSTVADDLVHLVRLLGLPFGDSSLLPTYWLCRGASEHVKVALSGDGGDELFYGYDRYRVVGSLLQRFGLLVRAAPLFGIDRSDPKSRGDKSARLKAAASGLGYPDLVAIFQQRDLKKLLRRTPTTYAEARGTLMSTRDARNWDIANYLPNDLLRKTDTASMACGIEVRCPFLARDVWKSVEHLSPSSALRGGQTKAILRRIASRHLPDDIVNRPKQGFAIPIGRWFREDFGGLGTMLMQLVGDPTRARDGRPFGAVHDVLEFNNTYITRMIDEHWEAGGARAPSGSVKVRPRDHSQRLYMLLVLAIWSRECLGSDSRHRHDGEQDENARERERAQ